MSQPIDRRAFGKVSAATALSAASVAATAAAEAAVASDQAPGARALPVLDVRPYQLMCVVCRLGQGKTSEPGDERLSEILTAVRQDPKVPLRLCCNTESVYRYQNPGVAEDTPQGTLFNIKRDLDILQKLGLVPGDARPAIDMFERLLAKVPTTKGICGYETATAETWQGCPRATSGDYEKGYALGIGAIIPPRGEQEKAVAKTSSVKEIYQAKALRIRPHHLMCMSCFHGGKAKLKPIAADNLFEPIDAIQKNPDIPVTLIAGCCMICPPCSHYDPKTGLCLGGRSMALRDQKKDLDVLQKLGLKYGDTLPARKLLGLLYERIPSTRDICGYGDGEVRAPEWSICGDPEGKESYRKARAAMLGIEG